MELESKLKNPPIDKCFEEDMIRQYPHRILMLGGLTGVGKTNILLELQKLDQQIIDLEGLANHRGSSFGNLNRLEQPSSDLFAEKLWKKWSQFSLHLPIWTEYELHYLGKVQMPRPFVEYIHQGTLVFLSLDRDQRIKNIIRQYANFKNKDLIAASLKLKKKLGEYETGRLAGFIKNQDYSSAVAILLSYYDQAYHHYLKLDQYKQVHYVELNGANHRDNAQMLIKMGLGN